VEPAAREPPWVFIEGMTRLRSNRSSSCSLPRLKAPFRFPRQVVAIDATWSAAKNMVKRLPLKYRRVYIRADAVAGDGQLAMPAHSLLRPIRKYDGFEGRMCTLEATVGLLRCVGEEAHRCDRLRGLRAMDGLN
jgi:DTW domain-containing protein YfiP